MRYGGGAEGGVRRAVRGEPGARRMPGTGLVSVRVPRPGPGGGRGGRAGRPYGETRVLPTGCYFMRVPVERRSAHALATRSAMLFSASLPQLRGS